MARLYIVSSCEKGHYRTYKAADSLVEAAKGLGHKVSLETQGFDDELSENLAAIEKADAVIISTTKPIIGSERFINKKVVEVHPETSIKNPLSVIKRALS